MRRAIQIDVYFTLLYSLYMFVVSVCIFKLQHCGIPIALYNSSLLPMLTCVLYLVLTCISVRLGCSVLSCMAAVDCFVTVLSLRSVNDVTNCIT